MNSEKENKTSPDFVQKLNTSNESKVIKWILIAVSVLFLFVMLVLPLYTVVSESLKKGFQFYIQSISDEYTLRALLLTVKATVAAVIVNTVFGLFAAWALTKFRFKGKKLLTTLIDIPITVSPWLEAINFKVVFAVPGIIIATVFVTFPYVSRELIPVMETQGTDEEEAAALMGAKGFTIFRRITFPHIKWAFLYGVVLCTARAMGEFGAVSVLSGHLRGMTNTLPLHVEILFNEFQYVPAFAVSSILVIIAIVILIIRSVIEYRGKKE